MISKHLTAHSFYHTCRYISNKPGAELLIAEGVRGYDFKLMAEDFIMQQALRPGKKLACMHAILSFYPGEKPVDKQMKEIAQEYLKELNIVNTQYAISKHTDKSHLHLHIVANMVNNDGKAISNSWIGLRGKKIAQKLTLKHQLVQAIEKNLKFTHLESLNEYEATRYKIFMAISEQLPKCKTIDQLENNLKKHGVETIYKYKGQTHEKQGVSFKMGNYSYKGSKIDRKFSYLSLAKTLALQQSLEQKQRFIEKLNQPQINSGQAVEKEKIFKAQQQNDPDINRQLGKGISDIWNAVVEPVKEETLVPQELLKKQKRKKQRKPSFS